MVIRHPWRGKQKKGRIYSGLFLVKIRDFGLESSRLEHSPIIELNPNRKVTDAKA